MKNFRKTCLVSGLGFYYCQNAADIQFLRRGITNKLMRVLLQAVGSPEDGEGLLIGEGAAGFTSDGAGGGSEPLVYVSQDPRACLQPGGWFAGLRSPGAYPCRFMVQSALVNLCGS